MRGCGVFSPLLRSVAIMDIQPPQDEPIPPADEPIPREPTLEEPPPVPSALANDDTRELGEVEPPSFARPAERRGLETRTISVRVPESQRPDPASPRALGRRRFLTLQAFAQAVLPPGSPIPHSASDLAVAERIDASATAFDSEVRSRIRRALRFWELQAVLTRSLRPFSRLPSHAAVGVVERAASSRWPARRDAFAYLKSLVVNTWASTAPVEQAVGFTYACVSPSQPQSAPRLEVVSYPTVDRDHVEECDAVIVGSGAGGAVVARELAEVGLSVIVLEEGGLFERKDFAGPPWERVQRLYRGQGLMTTAGSPAMMLPLGRAVGGTTVVGSGSCYRTPDDVLTMWSAEQRIEALDPESMSPWFDRVERTLHVKPVPEEILGENARVFRRGVGELGLSGDVMRRAIQGCRGCGVCTYGCPSDAKQSMQISYLPRAQNHGAGIYSHCRAERILIQDGRARGVEGALLDPRTGEPRARLTVRAKVVVLASGAIHTPALLAANALGGRSGWLGRNLSLQPRARVCGMFDADVTSWRGTQQSFSVEEWRAAHGLMIQVTSVTPGTIGAELPEAGAALKESLANVRKIAAADVVVADTSRGTVQPRRGEPLVRYRVGKQDERRLVRGISHAAEILLAAGARRVLTAVDGVPEASGRQDLERLREASIPSGGLRLVAEHPAGTARMGGDPAESVTDAWGLVRGVEGLVVADASLLPGPATVPPMVTIMALATRGADYLVRNGARFFA